MLTRIDCAHLLTADEHQPYVPAAAVLVRGDAIGDVVSETVKKSLKGATTTQKIDRVVTNRWLGIPIFIVIMTLV